MDLLHFLIAPRYNRSQFIGFSSTVGFAMFSYRLGTTKDVLMLHRKFSATGWLLKWSKSLRPKRRGCNFAVMIWWGGNATACHLAGAPPRHVGVRTGRSDAGTRVPFQLATATFGSA